MEQIVSAQRGENEEDLFNRVNQNLDELSDSINPLVEMSNMIEKAANHTRIEY